MSVQEAFTAIADKNSDERWLISECDPKTSKLVLVAKGATDYNDFISQLCKDDKIYFAIYKAYGLDEKEACVSKRDKLVAVTWLGTAVAPLRRNAPLQTKQERDAIFTGVVTELQGSEEKFVNAEAVAAALLKIGGAHKPTCYELGETVRIPVEFYKGSQ